MRLEAKRGTSHHQDAFDFISCLLPPRFLLSAPSLEWGRRRKESWEPTGKKYSVPTVGALGSRSVAKGREF